CLPAVLITIPAALDGCLLSAGCRLRQNVPQSITLLPKITHNADGFVPVATFRGSSASVKDMLPN
ncbi:hypothetical protein, partial [Ilyomonas limi]|uniref:hypothetical protein n=1 Tax=Ilyomonas limi TaxID=2575867 RepID=UPI00197F3220